MTKQTWGEQAQATEWGPTISPPKSLHEVLNYTASVLGMQDGPASLGMIYSIKMLRWLMSDEGKAMLRAELQQAIGDAKIPTTFEQGRLFANRSAICFPSLATTARWPS